MGSGGIIYLFIYVCIKKTIKNYENTELSKFKMNVLTCESHFSEKKKKTGKKKIW